MGKQVRKQKTSMIVAGGFVRLAVYIGVAVFVVFAGRTAYHFGYSIFNQQAMASGENARDITVVVKQGDSAHQIGKILEDKGLVEDAKIFAAQEVLSNYKGKLQPGTYVLSTRMTPDEMMEIMARVNTDGQPIQQDSVSEEGSSDISDGVSEGSSPKQEEDPQTSQDEGGEEP